jgi:hypothetical protein
MIWFCRTMSAATAGGVPPAGRGTAWVRLTPEEAANVRA